MDWFSGEMGYGGIEPPFYDRATWTIVTRTQPPATNFGNTEVFHRQNLHEHIHWLQHAGSTWGIFSSCCQFGESQQFAKWLDAIGPDKRSRFFALHHKGETIVSLDGKTGVLKVHDKELSTTAEHFLGNSVGLFYAGRILLDASNFQNFSYPLGKFVVQALNIISRFPWNHTKIPYAPKTTDVTTNSIRSWKQVEQQATVLGILESAALVSEALSAGHGYSGDIGSSEFERTVREAVSRLFGAKFEQYSVAFRIWVGQHEKLKSLALGDFHPDKSNLYPALISFALIADAALNPPLPPVYSCDSWEQSLWKDIDPAIRFNLLVQAGAEMELPDRDITSQEALKWTVELLNRADLPGLHLDLHYIAEAETPSFNYDHQDDFSYLESVLVPRFLRLLKLRAVDCLALAAPGELVTRGVSTVLPEVLEAFKASFWAPLYLDNQYKFSSFMPDEATARFCESVNLRRGLRMAPYHPMTHIFKSQHHQAFAAMRPIIPEYAEPTLENMARQYGVWFED